MIVSRSLSQTKQGLAFKGTKTDTERPITLPESAIEALEAHRTLLAAGIELPAVSERLGHSSVYVTATVYSHVIKGRDEVAARKCEEFQKKNAGKSAGSKRV